MSTVVVGAGLAGVFAARTLSRAGDDVVVVEATGHLGGRTRGDHQALEHGQVADLGASWIDIGQDAILQFCMEHGIGLAPAVRMFPKGPGGTYSGASILLGNMAIGGAAVPQSRSEAVADEVQAALAQQPPSTVETLLAWARRVRLSAPARAAYVMQAGFNPVHRPELVSSWHVHPGDIGRLCWLVADGTDAIARVAAQGLDIRYDSPVRLIRRQAARYEVLTEHETLTADNVVVTSSVAATRRIGFDPVLPAWKVEALLQTPMAQGGKVVAQYRGAREILAAAGPSTMTDSHVSMFWLKQGPENTVTALGTAVDRGDGMLSDEAAILSDLDRQIATMTGKTPERVAGVVQDWTREQFFGGVVNLGTGGHARRMLLGAPVGGVHFAGEATGEWASAMEGAVRSGYRVADEILDKRAKGRARATGIEAR
jgi:monoamine oxidase